jgi:hypothetical protein
VSPRQRFVALSTVAVFAVPPIADLALGGTRRVFGYLAADAFYYLTVARNLWVDGSPSFDGVHATNGFHPLWQYALTALYGVVHTLGMSDVTMLYADVALCLALVAVALYLLARVFASARGSVPALFALVPAGLFAIVIAPLWKYASIYPTEVNPFEGHVPVWGSQWAYVNGMESAVLVLSWALLALVFVERSIFTSTRAAIALGAVMALVVLSRLDHAPFAVFPGVALLWAARRDSRALGRVLACAGTAAVPIGAYVASNVVFFGSAMPVSGSLKTTFPRPTIENWQNLAELLEPVEPIGWLERSGRVSLALIPMAVAVVLLARLRPGGVRIRFEPSARFDAFLRASAWAVLVLGAYDWLFVPWGGQGHWYFPVSTLFVSIAALRAWSGLARDFDRSRGALALAAVAAAGALAFFVVNHRRSDYHAHYADFVLEHAPAMREHFAGEPLRLVEYDDGVIGWGSGLPSLPASGLTLDPDGARRVHEGGLVPLAVSRGHLWFTSSIISVDAVYGNVRRSYRQGRVEVVYRAPDRFFGVVKVTPP